MYLYNTTIRKLIVLNKDGGLGGQLLFLLNVVAHVAQLFLHHPHGLKVRRVVEGIAPQEQQLDHVHGDVPPSYIQSPVWMWMCSSNVKMEVTENVSKYIFVSCSLCHLFSVNCETATVLHAHSVVTAFAY